MFTDFIKLNVVLYLKTGLDEEIEREYIVFPRTLFYDHCLEEVRFHIIKLENFQNINRTLVKNRMTWCSCCGLPSAAQPFSQKIFDVRFHSVIRRL